MKTSSTETLTWIQLKICIDQKQLACIEEMLEQQGACAITLLEPEDHPSLWEPDPNCFPLWDEIHLCALFENKKLAKPEQKNRLSALLAEFHVNQCRFESLENKAWETECFKYFSPIQINSKLAIMPSHLYGQHQMCGKILILDPGLAFGTGSHPTTALCLQWLSEQAIEGKSVIDYGCGSGILSIAAALMGAAKVFAIDTDPQALTATANNAAKNCVNNKIQILPPSQAPALPGDILIANILAGPILQLKEKFHVLIKPGGLIALSGLLTTQKLQVITEYQDRFQINQDFSLEEWTLLSGKSI